MVRKTTSTIVLTHSRRAPPIRKMPTGFNYLLPNSSYFTPYFKCTQKVSGFHAPHLPHLSQRTVTEYRRWATNQHNSFILMYSQGFVVSAKCVRPCHKQREAKRCLQNIGNANIGIRLGTAQVLNLYVIS